MRKRPGAMRYRTEKDSMGMLQVPMNALYAAQTQRAVLNFPVSGLAMPPEFIRALALVKASAAEANMELGLLARNAGRAIVKAAEEVCGGAHHGDFPVDVFQTGSGTSTNMNMNEVLATLANRRLGKGKVSPNDHVNMSQSSNDSIPTAVHVSAAIQIKDDLLPALGHLSKTLRRKASSCRRLVKTGRTHLMDAMPVRLSQELLGWDAQVAKGIVRLKESQSRLRMIAQGGTAVGTGINAHPRFARLFARKLKARTGIAFTPNGSFFESLGSQDTAVEVSGQLRTVAVSMMKIANDLRWMNSGPLAGLGEIELEPLQPGSSIMPGKVNPVIPEMAAMVAAQVIGNDATIVVAGQSGNFQLNVMLPVVAHNLLESVRLLSSASRLLADKAVATFRPRKDNMEKALALNPILVTALNPVIGYLKAAEIAKKAYAARRPIIDVAAEQTGISRAELARLLDPARLTDGGIS